MGVGTIDIFYIIVVFICSMIFVFIADIVNELFMKEEYKEIFMKYKNKNKFFSNYWFQVIMITLVVIIFKMF